MIKIGVLKARKRKIQRDIAAFVVRLNASTESLEKAGLQARLDELKIGIDAINSLLKTAERLNGVKAMNPEAEIMTALNIVPPHPVVRKRRSKKRGRSFKAKEEGEKALFEI